MAYGAHGWCFFPLFFFGLAFLFFIFRMVAWRRFGGYPCGAPYGRHDAETILMRRLASGEITEDEYRRLKETLSK